MCWDSGLRPAAEKFRALLGPSAIIYTNSCPSSLRRVDKIPAVFDLLSADFYADYLPGSSGDDEVNQTRELYQGVLPKLAAHQRLMLVPGVFACANLLKSFPLEAQSSIVERKLDHYFRWALTDTRIAGLNPWHLLNRTKPQSGAKCDMALGATAMPGVMRKLRAFGKAIVTQQKVS